jgi:starvation-inducible DNA-binding protein
MENERLDVFWSSVHPWSQLGQRFWPGFELQTNAGETPRLFSIDQSAESCRLLNDALADSIVLHGLYNKEYWLVRSDFHSELEQLLRQHACEQLEFIDQLAERVHALGGVAISDPRHVAEVTAVPSTPNGFEEPPAVLYRILEAHRIIIQKMHCVITSGEKSRGAIADQRLMSDMMSRHEHQAWLVAEHLVGTLTNA